MARDVWERLHEILYTGNPECVVYVYRVGPDGKRKKPYYLKCHLVTDLLEMLRDYHGGGDFWLMIREGRTLVFSGEIGIEPLPGRARATSGWPKD